MWCCPPQTKIGYHLASLACCIVIRRSRHSLVSLLRSQKPSAVVLRGARSAPPKIQSNEFNVNSIKTPNMSQFRHRSGVLIGGGFIKREINPGFIKWTPIRGQWIPNAPLGSHSGSMGFQIFVSPGIFPELVFQKFTFYS